MAQVLREVEDSQTAQAVERVLEKQRVINTEGQDDQDVVALASGDDETCAQVFFFRSGKLVGREYFILQGTRDSSPGEIMALPLIYI